VNELERTGQYFVPVCGRGSCRVFDLRGTTATECDSDDDCSLRDGSACCEGCDGTSLVALSSTEYVDATCPNTGCHGCAPNIPAEFEAGCNDNGHCVVRQNPSPGR
jgi:hypothetical protein